MRTIEILIASGPPPMVGLAWAPLRSAPLDPSMNGPASSPAGNLFFGTVGRPRDGPIPTRFAYPTQPPAYFQSIAQPPTSIPSATFVDRLLDPTIPSRDSFSGSDTPNHLFEIAPPGGTSS